MTSWGVGIVVGGGVLVMGALVVAAREVRRLAGMMFEESDLKAELEDPPLDFPNRFESKPEG
jgi:hypothetical protein